MLANRPLKQTCIALAIAQCSVMPNVQAGVYNISATSNCTFRDAVTAANTNQASGACGAGSSTARDTINLHSNFTFTESSAQAGNALPFINSKITINGNGFTLARSPIAPFMRFIGVIDNGAGENADLILNDITLANGNLYGFNGGAIFVGSSATLTMDNVTLTANTAVVREMGVGAGGRGGALFSLGQVTISNSKFSSNSATFGGAIYTGSVVTNDARLTISNSSINHNYSSNSGGGIIAKKAHDLTLRSSTVSGNTARTRDGGGIDLYRSNDAQIINSTISGNTAGDDGGGLSTSGSSSLNITNSTIAINSAGDDGGGIYTFSSNYMEINNTIVAGNTAVGSADEAAINGLSFNIHNNLLGDVTKTQAQAFGKNVPSAAENIFAFGIPLSATIQTNLSANGGATKTYALPSNSAARNAGGNANCPSVDQRGNARTDNSCDIGAFEFGPNDSETCFVSATQSGKIVTFCL